ncbi:MAG: hypothetical protein P8J32_00405 [bacterium]|jgi:hypothetical protein|nr:hypothetical protein [bacterium]
MSTTTMLTKLRVPAIVLTLASLILIPAAFVSASEGEGEHERPKHRPPAIAFEITSVSDGSIEGIFVNVPSRLAEEKGVEEGDALTVTYTDETKFMEERAEVTVDAFEVGETVFALGRINFDSMTIDAKAIVDQPVRPHFRIGEVVEVDTDANTILVQALRPNQENAEENYVLISYDGDTIINEDGEEVDESAISVGDKIHVRGEVNNESDDYFAEIDAENIQLWDEKEPRRPGHGQGPRGEFPTQAE